MRIVRNSGGMEWKRVKEGSGRSLLERVESCAYSALMRLKE